MDSIGARFKHARRLRGLTQRAVARYFDVDTGTVYRWESGHSPLALTTLEAAAELLGVDRAWLAFGDGEPPASSAPSSSTPSSPPIEAAS